MSETTEMMFYIIDDEREVAETVRDGLELGLKCECFLFSSVDECLVQLDKKLPQIILSDVHMPTGSGLRIIEELKNRKVQVPTIFITGVMDKTPKEENVIMIRKPVNFKNLISLIQKELR